MLLVVCAVLCLQADPAPQEVDSAAAETLIDITRHFEQERGNVEREYAQRRGMLLLKLVQDLEKIQTDLTRDMKFDNALRVRMIGERFRTLKTADEQLDALKELLPEAPESVTPIMNTAVSDDAEIQAELKSNVARLAALCIDQLQELLETKSSAGDLDACLDIRRKMEELRAKYHPNSSLPTEFPTTEDGLAILKSQLVEASRQRIAVRLDELGTQLAGLKLKTIAERRILAQVVLKVTKERDQDEKVRLLRGMVDMIPGAKVAVRNALTDIDGEIMSNSRELTRLERRLEAVRDNQLRAAIEEWQVDEAVRYFRKLQQTANDFRWQCQPEIANELPPLDRECARIMDRFEAMRQVEEQQFTERLQPGVAELKRRLVTAQAAAPAEARQSRQAIERCLKWLESGAADSLEEFRLIPVTLDLPDVVQAGAFAEAADILLNERHEFRHAGLARLTEELRPEVARLASAGDLPACVSVFVHVRWLERRFDPQPASMARVPWETATVEANVLDVAGRLVRVRQTSANLSHWHPRRLIRIEGEPALPLEASTGNDGWRTAERFLPGPVTSRHSDIEQGTRFFWLRGNLWELVTVTERHDSDVTIQSTIDGKPRTDRIDWRGLYQLAW